MGKMKDQDTPDETDFIAHLVEKFEDWPKVSITRESWRCYVSMTALVEILLLRNPPANRDNVTEELAKWSFKLDQHKAEYQRAQDAWSYDLSQRTAGRSEPS